MSDLIRRQDAIDEIQMLLEQFEDDEHDKTWNNAIRGAVNAVKHHTKSAQPTIDAVEVVHGEWIEADDLEGAIKGRVFCSNCKNPFESIVMTNEKIILTNQKTKYCPNCGAKMDGERRE